MRPKTIPKALAVAMCVMLAQHTSRAQDDAHRSLDQPFTAESLVAWVLQENPGLAAAQATAEAAAHRIEPAGSLDDPMLSYGAAPLSSDQSFEFSQRVPWPGTLRAREDAARHEASAANWSAGAERLALAAAAKSAYSELYFVTNALEIHYEIQAFVEELISTAETRYAAGTASRQDVLQAEVEKAELKARELQLLGNRTAAFAGVNELLNRAPDAPLPPVGSIPVEWPALNMEALERRAVDRHPELRRLDAQIAAAGSRVTVAQKAFFPDFQVYAGYNEMWDDPDMRPMLGVSINIPFDRGKREAELDRSQAEVRRAEWTRSDQRSRLLADLARAHAEVVEAVQSIELYEGELVPLAEQYLEAAIADYRSGTGAFLNVVTAEQRNLNTELALERARADYLRRVAELELLTGGALEYVPARYQGEEK